MQKSSAAFASGPLAEDTGLKNDTCQMDIQGKHRLYKQRVWDAYLRQTYGEPRQSGVSLIPGAVSSWCCYVECIL